MDNTSLGQTSLEHIPQEILHPKRKTNRAWTFVIILVVIALFGAFWYIKRAGILENQSPVVSVTVPQSVSMNDLESDLSNTAIPDFHEVL